MKADVKKIACGRKWRQVRVRAEGNIWSSRRFCISLSEQTLENSSMIWPIWWQDAKRLKFSLFSTNCQKEEIQIVFELRRGTDTKNRIYSIKKTKLEDTFGVNMLAVADGRQKTIWLKKINKYHVNFQFSLVTCKYQNLLVKGACGEKKRFRKGVDENM